MNERTFIDTNVFLYADDRDAGSKREKAQQSIVGLIESGCAVLSTQVLQEFIVNAIGKLRLAPELVHTRVEALTQLDVVLIRPELVLTALDLHRLRPISFWDALIVRAAAVSCCTRVLTEDLQHGQVIDGVRIENPFGSK